MSSEATLNTGMAILRAIIGGAALAAAAVGPTPFTDYTNERPGKRVNIVAADLPPPKVTPSVDNPPHVVKRPKDVWPQAPAGFQVQLYADGLSKPRLIRVAPNGDAFVVESKAGVMRVFRGLLDTGKASWSGVATGTDSRARCGSERRR